MWVTLVAYVVGLPTVVTAKVNAVVAVAVAVAALVKVGTGTLVESALTVRVIVWVVVPPGLVAVIVRESVPAVTAVVPDKDPVPLPLSEKLTPAGRVPALSVAVG